MKLVSVASVRSRRPTAEPPGSASKADTQRLRLNSAEFYALGWGDVYPVSGLHGAGTGDLLDAVVAALKQNTPVAEAPEMAEEDTVRVALVGRPNVGKSSLFNTLIGEPRVIVSDIPGTTRDAVDTQITFSEKMADGQVVQNRITLVDTAGIRKRGSITPGVEKWSVLRSLKAIERADVALLLLDATQGIVAQDEHVGGYILDANKGAVVLVNKWDAVESAAEVARSAQPVKGVGMLTPKMQEIRERYKDDQATLQKEVMELYKRHRVNPVSGCLPMLLQLPIFVGLYNALMHSIELRHAPFMLWINDLSAPDRLTSSPAVSMRSW